MDTLLQDLRYAVRTLRQHPGFALVAVLTLALGIGANTAIFSVVNSLLIRPLPHIVRPAELVLIGRTVNDEGFDTFSYPDYADLRDQSRALAGVAAYSVVPAHVSGAGATERLRGALVSGNYFAVLGSQPALGRFFLPEEDRPGSPAYVAVLGAGLWQRTFGGRSDVLGTTIRIDNHPYTVVGVAPAGFQGTTVGDQLDVFVPLATQPIVMARFGSMLGLRDAVWLQAFGRLAPGVPFARAREEVQTFGRRLAMAFPEGRRGWGVTLSAGAGFDPITRRNVTEFLRILQGAVALVLLVACANVANLLLVRATSRRKELALRASLGAGRGRLARQLLTESLLLSILGGIGGVVVTYASIDALRALPIFRFPGGVALSPDARVLGFTLAISVLTGLVFGLVPAIQGSRHDLAAEIREGAQTERPKGARLRNGLVVAQIAVSLVLLVAAGLFVRTLRNAYAIDPGFATRDVVVARLDLGLQGYDEARGRRFQDELLSRLEALPGVQAAGLALNLPFSGGFDTRIAAEGAAIDPEQPGHRTDRNSVTPDYFRTMGIAIARGRGFTSRDVVAAPLVSIVNEAVAEQLWPGQDPVGKRFVRTWGGPPIEVIGVARDAKYRNLFEARRLTFYQPLAQDYQPAIVVHLRVAGDPRMVAGALERTVHDLDRDLPVYRVETLEDRLDASLGQQRTAATVVGAFGVLALLLAAIGLYAAVAYAVAQRTREIGIRLAIGAASGNVLRRILGQGVTLALVGLAIGVVVAAGVTRLIRSQLYGVTPLDPLNLTLVSLLLIIVAAVASYLPARRAAKVDPVVALRAE